MRQPAGFPDEPKCLVCNTYNDADDNIRASHNIYLLRCELCGDPLDVHAFRHPHESGMSQKTCPGYEAEWARLPAQNII